MQKRLIGSGHGWRIVAPQFSRFSWSTRDLYHTGTVIVRMPNSRHDDFQWSLVATDGIAGSPQLTFDDPAMAQQFIDDHVKPRYPDLNFRLSKTRGYYNCYKIPIEGTEAWLCDSNFPQEGTEAWNKLANLYPDYFEGNTGFFTEDLNEDIEVGNIKLKIGDTFVTNTEEVREHLFGRGCYLASNAKFKILDFDLIYTTREIPCAGGFYDVDDD